MSDDTKELIPKKFHFGNPPKRDYGKIDRRKNRRPLLFTAGRKKKIVAALNAGASIGVAASYAGISKDTLKRWITRGQEAGPNSKGADQALYKFSEECLQAQGSNALAFIGITAGYLKDRQSKGEVDVKDAELSLKALEKLHPDEYGTKKGEIKHEHEVKGSIEHRRVDLSNLSIDQLKQLREISKQMKESEDVIDAEIIDNE